MGVEKNGTSIGQEVVELSSFKWIGMGIVIASAVLSNLGVNIQKLSHIHEDKRRVFARRPYYTRPMWIVGMILVVLGSIGDFEALAFAPQALVASVGGGCVVLANVFFAHLWLGQALSCTDIAGTLFIIIGVVLSSLMNEPDAQLSLEELKIQFMESEFLIYVATTVVCLSFFLIRIKQILKYPKNDNTVSYYRKLPYYYATVAGIFGSFSVLLAKCTSMLLLYTFQGNNQFLYLTTYFFFGGMIATLILQTDFLNRAIMCGDTLSVFPVFQCFWIGCSVIGGVVYYQKFSRFSLYEWIFLPLALVCIIFGIYLLSKHREHDHLTPNRPKRPGASSRHIIKSSFVSLIPVSPASSRNDIAFDAYGSIIDHNEPDRAQSYDAI